MTASTSSTPTCSGRCAAGAGRVVTSLEFSLLPLATAYAGSIAFDAEHAPAVFARFMEWAATCGRGG